jgi:hypothetical protein
VAGHLNVDAEPEEPVTVKENAYNKDTQCLEQVQRIPKDVGMGSL